MTVPAAAEDQHLGREQHAIGRWAGTMMACEFKSGTPAHGCGWLKFTRTLSPSWIVCPSASKVVSVRRPSLDARGVRSGSSV